MPGICFIPSLYEVPQIWHGTWQKRFIIIGQHKCLTVLSVSHAVYPEASQMEMDFPTVSQSEVRGAAMVLGVGTESRETEKEASSLEGSRIGRERKEPEVERRIRMGGWCDG